MNDKKEVTTVDMQASANMLAIIDRAIRDPSVDVAKLEKMLELNERFMEKQAEIEFNQAMARLQADLPVVDKKGMIEFTDKNNVAHKTPFAKYEDIDAAIRPNMKCEGFSVAYDSVWGSDGVTMTGTLSHRDGHSKKATVRLPLDTSGSKNNLQAMGSTISYGKRYLLGMLINLVTKGEDDDGSASSTISVEQAAEIDKKLNELNADKPAFLKLFKAQEVLQIQAKDYQQAMQFIAKKEKANAAKK